MHTAIPVHAFFTFAVFVVQITNIPVQYTGIPSFFDDVRGIFPIQPCVCRYVFPTRDMLILPLLGCKPCDVMANPPLPLLDLQPLLYWGPGITPFQTLKLLYLSFLAAKCRLGSDPFPNPGPDPNPDSSFEFLSRSATSG